MPVANQSPLPPGASSEGVGWGGSQGFYPKPVESYIPSRTWFPCSNFNNSEYHFMFCRCPVYVLCYKNCCQPHNNIHNHKNMLRWTPPGLKRLCTLSPWPGQCCPHLKGHLCMALGGGFAPDHSWFPFVLCANRSRINK